MSEQKLRRTWVQIARDINYLLIALTFDLVWCLTFPPSRFGWLSPEKRWITLLTCGGMYVFLGTVYDAFELGTERIVDLVFSQTLAVFITDLLGFVCLWVMVTDFRQILPFWLIFPVQLLLVCAWCYFANRWYFAHFPRKRTLVLTCDADDVDRLSTINGFSRKFDIVTVVDTDRLLSDPERLLKNIDAVFLMNRDKAWAVMQTCAFMGVTMYRIPMVSEILASSARTMTLFHVPLLRMDGYSPSFAYTAVKRCMDVVISGAGLLLLSPLMVVIAIAIKLDDGGPVFYRQERLTQGKKRFMILKFRSMCVNAESDGVIRLSTGKHDARITRVGRVIRALRLDELPQLFNILKGDMSVVGPRPERPQLAAEYAKALPEFDMRLLTKAGLTGYAQVYGKYNTTPEDKLRMDLMYILHPSILEDIKLMFATVKILFIPESTEGVAEGQTTAMKDAPQQDEQRKAASGL